MLQDWTKIPPKNLGIQQVFIRGAAGRTKIGSKIIAVDQNWYGIKSWNIVVILKILMGSKLVLPHYSEV